MNKKKISFHVYGKLMLSGEWSILEPGNSCISLPTQGIYFEIKRNHEIALTSTTYNINNLSYTFMQENNLESTNIAMLAIEAGLRLIHRYKKKLINFHITLNNNPATYIKKDNTIHKLGIGSSACVTVGIIKSLMLFHDIPLNDVTIFNTAFAVHKTVQKINGSGYDIAAAVSGHAIKYQSNTNINQFFKKISIPTNWHFAVGYTGVSADTPVLITIFNKNKYLKLKKINTLLQEIESTVHLLEEVITINDITLGMILIKKNRILLTQLSELCEHSLETEPIKHMIKLAEYCGAAAKFSGSGGGDCVIALCPNEEIKNNVYQIWENEGFFSAKNILACEEGLITK